MIAPKTAPDQGLAVMPQVLPVHLPTYPIAPPIIAPIINPTAYFANNASVIFDPASKTS